MRAIYIEQYGNADKLTLGEQIKPVIEQNQVLIKVEGAGINPVDWMVREGFLASSGEHQLPLVLGWDAAGKIVEKGEGVTNIELGDEVYVYAPISGQGAYAEYIAVDSQLVASKPKSLDIVTAAAVPLAATTAWQALLDGCHLKAGDRVLIHNAAGGVGSFAVQIAKAKGAYVIGTASQSKKAYVESLGVDEFIDYRTQRFEDVVKDVDSVLVAIGADNTAERSLSVVRKGGHIISLLDEVDANVAMQHGVNFQRWWVTPNSSDLQQISNLIDSGDIQVHIDKVFSLSEVKQAHALSESNRAQGKIVLKVSE